MTRDDAIAHLRYLATEICRPLAEKHAQEVVRAEQDDNRARAKLYTESSTEWQQCADAIDLALAALDAAQEAA